MEKLFYEKAGDVVIDIDLHNGYLIRCMANYNHETRRYDANFYIKESTIDKYHLIDDLYNQNVSFDGNYKTIKKDMLQYVTVLHSQKYFEKEIKNLEFENRCFDAGCEILETKRVNEKKK